MMRDGKVVPTVFDCITYLPDIKAYFQSMETKHPDDRQFRMYKEIIDESLNLLNEQEAQRDYEASVEMAEYCERYEQTYNPEDGSM